MKIQIKDLEPNPFRDIKNYPIDEEKVKCLTNSINQTGFWDNILARQKDGKIQIAYGHHRLIVLQKEFKPTDVIDIPIRDLDDPTMIQVMANENHESWGMLPKVIDETIRVAKKYLEEHPEEVERLLERTKASTGAFSEVGADIIHRFLGKNWSESRISYSLERMDLHKTKETHEKHVDKKATDILPTERSARNLIRAIKQIKNVTPEQQRRAAERMVKESNLGESSAVKAILEEKYRDKPEQKKEKIFEEFIGECREDTDKLNKKARTLLEYEKEFNSEYYQKTFERLDFMASIFKLIESFGLLFGRNFYEKRSSEALLSSNNQK